MKKIILTSTALLAFAAASYAQINQTGLQQYAEQIRNGQNQTGTINQLQGTNTNYGNYAITIQGQQSNTGPAVANINQNDGSQSNRAGITQNGGTNVTANINQNGGGEGLSGGGTSASATIGAPGGDGNFAGIAQLGSNLAATINQNNNSRRNGAEVYQNGTGLTSLVNQSNGAINNDVFILQGYSGQNVAGTAISGATATVNQGRQAVGDTGDGSLVAESVSAFARIIQNADNVTATISQGTRSAGGAANSNGRADGSVAMIEQRAGSTASTALVEQGVQNAESFGSRAMLIQTGSSNVGIIGQGGSSITTGLFGPGTQGSDQGSVANLTQNGSGNAGAPNIGAIIQGASGGTTLENVANLNQAAGTQNGTAFIAQGVGTGSFSSNDEARITQASKATTGGVLGLAGAVIVQGFTTGTGSSTGRLNLAIVDQKAEVTNGIAAVVQGLSTGGANLTASRNTGSITQVSGSNLRAGVQQGGSAPFVSAITGIAPVTNDIFGTALNFAANAGSIATNNSGTIVQGGGTNLSAQIVQNGRFNTGLITQNGAGTNANAAQIVQAEGANRGYAEILQNAGANNTATIVQLSGSDTDNSGVGNYARVQQLVGSNNVAAVQQGRPISTGPNSSNDNFFDLIQNGSSNNVQFLQQGNNNYALIRQNANNNVVQGVGGGVASQIGYNNRLMLTQNGNSSSNLVFSNTQVGNNLTAVQTQNAN